MDLSDLRDQINSVDASLLELLATRRKLAQEVIEIKNQEDMPLRDADREQELLSRLITVGRTLGLDAHFVTRVYHEIIDDSVRSQQLWLLQGLNRDHSRPERVAFQGVEGAYSHLAAQKFFAAAAEEIQFQGCVTFAQVVESVEEGTADFAILPVENTTAGNINDVYDLLSRTRLSIVGEEIFRVRHCLVAIEDVPVSRIRHIISHPQALAQCAIYLSKLRDCKIDYFADTAMAVRKVKEDGDRTQAAIASEESARLYGLSVIARDLADQPQNFTRFVVVAPKPIKIDWRVPSKTSIITATSHTPGALLKALDVLKQFEINMTKLDARPKPGSPFDYLFYIDFEGHLDEPRVKDAMKGLRAVTSYLKVLGSYPRAERGKTHPRTEHVVPKPEPERKSPVRGASTAPPAAETTPRPSATPGTLHSRDANPDDTILRVREVDIGGPDLVVLAGPGIVRSEDQVRRVARALRESGARIMRGGCYQPRTAGIQADSMTQEQLHLLARVAREYDLPLAVEVAAPEDVAAAAHSADILIIGARNMQNFALLDEVGSIHRPVILKRGTLASLEEFLAAAEYILELGNHQVILCERGIRTFETVTRNTLDLGAIPLLERLTHLPLIVDPSRAAAQHDLVIPLALAARAVGAQGLLVEVDLTADTSSDGAQTLGVEEFATLMARLYPS